MYLRSPYLRALVGVILLSTILMGACTEKNIKEEASSSKVQTPSIEDRAKALLTQAWTHEPKVTELLKTLSAEHGGRMVGLEYRLKSEGSTIRKLKKISSENPQMPIKDLSIYDALRYTIEASDHPPGHHVKVIQEVLKQLEAKGYQVKTVKNYWPKGDNYSGVNAVLMTQDRFEWELQFHTPESVLESRRSHKLYEELRAEETTLARKQVLFHEMSTPWEQIPVPANILEEKNLHPQELIKSMSAPSAQ